MTHTAVITIVAGRHRHLSAQQLALAAGQLRPDLIVVVAMGDPGVRSVVDVGPFVERASANRVMIEALAVPDQGQLPLARARNVGAARAMREGAELLVFLDVDCLPSATLMSRYEEAARRVTRRKDEPQLLCGPVAYLPPLRGGRTSYDAASLAEAVPHRARPTPTDGVIEPAEDMRLFWSLSFAVTPEDWKRCGGFDEGYTGYGGEDTDFAQRAGVAGGRLSWVGGATAFHQWHPVSDPPIEHLYDIVRNANRFHSRWGRFPMEGWLEAFEAEGLAHYDPKKRKWTCLSSRPVR